MNEQESVRFLNYKNTHRQWLIYIDLMRLKDDLRAQLVEAWYSLQLIVNEPVSVAYIFFSDNRSVVRKWKCGNIHTRRCLPLPTAVVG